MPRSGAAAHIADVIGRALDAAARVLCDVAGWLLAAMVVLINVEVAARYVFYASTLIADEYSGYLFVWLTLLGFGYALQSGQFLRVESVVARLSAPARRAADLVAALAALAVTVVCIDATWSLLAASWRFGSRSIQPSATPLWLAQLLLPLGFAFLALLYVHAIARALLGRPSHAAGAEPAAAERAQ